MPRIRPKFDNVQYQIWTIFPDGTEDLAATFKYEKAANKYITKWRDECALKNVRLELRVSRNNVL